MVKVRHLEQEAHEMVVGVVTQDNPVQGLEVRLVAKRGRVNNG